MLEVCKYPKHTLVIDFETYWDEEFGFEQLSTIEYVCDPRFEVVSCGFRIGDRQLWGVGEAEVQQIIGMLQSQYGANLEGLTVVAQNAMFEATVLWKHYGINPPHIIDTLGLARHLNSRQRNDLASLCKQYKLPDKGETAKFKQFTFRDRMVKPKGKNKQPIEIPKPTEEQIAALREYNLNDVEQEWALFQIMLPLLTNPQVELRVMQTAIEMFTRPILRVDMEKGKELAALYEQQIDNAIPEGLTREDISGNVKFERHLVRALEQAGDSAMPYMKFGKKKALLALAKTDSAREVLLNHPDPAV